MQNIFLESEIEVDLESEGRKAPFQLQYPLWHCGIFTSFRTAAGTIVLTVSCVLIAMYACEIVIRVRILCFCSPKSAVSVKWWSGHGEKRLQSP
jgi:hypothetical protein